MSNSAPVLKRYELFPSLVWTCQLQDFAEHNRAMLAHVLDLYEHDPGMEDRSNIIGWHSRDQLHQEPDFSPLKHQIEALLHHEVAQDLQLDLTQENYRVKAMWAIVSPTYAYNQLHRHPGCLFSGVYYLQIPQNAGVLNFHDPRADVRMLRPCFTKGSPFRHFAVRFEPVVDRLLLFPAWLPHNVEPNLGQHPRVAISFNIEGYPVLDADSR